MDEKKIIEIFKRRVNETPKTIKRIPHGVMTFKYDVTTRNGRYILRVYPEGREHILRFEPDIIRRCVAMDIPAPEVYADSRTDPVPGPAYMIYGYIEGFPLSFRLHHMTEAQLLAFCGNIVTALQKMAAIPIEGFGELVSADQGVWASWRDFLDSSFSDGLTALAKGSFCSKDQLQHVASLYERVAGQCVEERGKVIFSDLRPENLLATPEMNLAALIDFEGILSADPLLSLGYCYAACGNDVFFEAMARSWEDRMGPIDWQRLDLYAVLRVMRIAVYLNQPLPVGKKRDPIEKFSPGFFRSLHRAAAAT